MAYDLFIFAGEQSGDNLGELFLKELAAARPRLKIAGVGGPQMKPYLSLCVMPFEKFQVMGFLDICLSFFKILFNFFKLKRAIQKLNPKVALFIDYPGFNLRMERALKKSGFKGKIVHFVSPSVWAWGKKRIPIMAETLDALLSILPFEKRCFEHTKLNVEFIGHPLVKKVHSHNYKKIPPLENSSKKILAIFPGSRTKEIERCLPLQLRAAKAFCKKHPEFMPALSVAHPKLFPFIQKAISHAGLGSELILTDHTACYDLMQHADLALATSGTVNLELCLHKIPTVVSYGISQLDLFLALFVFKIHLPYYCIVNLLAEKAVYPELYGPRFTEENALAALEGFFKKNAYQECRDRCEEVKQILGERDASSEAASYILKLFDSSDIVFTCTKTV